MALMPFLARNGGLDDASGGMTVERVHVLLCGTLLALNPSFEGERPPSFVAQSDVVGPMRRTTNRIVPRPISTPALGLSTASSWRAGSGQPMGGEHA